jgi:hypothetical protein
MDRNLDATVLEQQHEIGGIALRENHRSALIADNGAAGRDLG